MKNIANALIEFRKSVGTVKKGADNPFFRSKYADLPTVLKAINEPLCNAGLALAHTVTRETVDTVLIHAETGETLQSSFPIDVAGKKTQEVGSQITYARRYNICALLDISADEDDDGNAAQSPIKEPAKVVPTPEDYERFGIKTEFYIDDEGNKDWNAFADYLIAVIKTAQTVEDIEIIRVIHKLEFGRMSRADAELGAIVRKALGDQDYKITGGVR